ncbi:hypothetical protein GCM10010466_46050 [Planomonospora alba]|uniref:Uncharacterized protein n=1 Tax=Planomonospora alba TaxID=161354 RepID=A0ABP6NNV5_9ACTN
MRRTLTAGGAASTGVTVTSGPFQCKTESCWNRVVRQLLRLPIGTAEPLLRASGALPADGAVRRERAGCPQEGLRGADGQAEKLSDDPVPAALGLALERT